MDDRQPITRPEPSSTGSCPWCVATVHPEASPDISSSRLHQHDAHGVGLKAVRPRLRLRALRLDPDTAHTPAQQTPGTTRKTDETPLSPDLTGPAPSWMTPRTLGY